MDATKGRLPGSLAYRRRQFARLHEATHGNITWPAGRASSFAVCLAAHVPGAANQAVRSYVIALLHCNPRRARAEGWGAGHACIPASVHASPVRGKQALLSTVLHPSPEAEGLASSSSRTDARRFLRSPGSLAWPRTAAPATHGNWPFCMKPLTATVT